MNNTIKDILLQDSFSKDDIVTLLKTTGEERTFLFKTSTEIKEKYIGKKVWFRGLIEFSNICGKDCLYCGIRKGNKNLERYSLDDDEILQAAKFAYSNRYGSIALQSGELESSYVSGRIATLLKKIREMSNGELGVTLSVGEQEPEVYRRWFEAGAHRYLLRVESTNPDLYNRIHPADSRHSFSRRIECLKSLQADWLPDWYWCYDRSALSDH